jgi:hypothetical protein
MFSAGTLDNVLILATPLDGTRAADLASPLADLFMKEALELDILLDDVG